jgi:hypothetical protein
MTKKTWNNPPTLVKLPAKYADILTLTAIALDRGTFTEADLLKFIEGKVRE